MATTLQMPGNSRAPVRSALLNHPDRDTVLKRYGVPRVNMLTNAQLLEACELCGINAPAIVAAALSNAAPVSTIVQNAIDVDNVLHSSNLAEAITEAEDIASAETETVDIANEAAALRRKLASALVEGDFDAVTGELAQLITEARKPAEVITVTVPAVLSPDGSAPVHLSRKTGKRTWRELFQVPRDDFISTWDCPTAPAVNPGYRFPRHETEAALCAIRRGENIWLFGPPGTGKSSWAREFAARTHRPFVLISCDDTTEAPELIGMTTPHNGSTVWRDGILIKALRTPGAVVLIDEPTVARAGAQMVLQSILEGRTYDIKETGEHVVCTDGVVFICADNTNGTGQGAASGYEDTRRMNVATLDRFAIKLLFEYMSKRDECRVIVDRVKCTPQLASLLVDCATVTRTDADNGKLNAALGLRRMFAWAGQLTDGIPPKQAFENAVLNGAPADDRETLRHLCKLALSPQAISAALAGQEPAADATVPLSSDPATAEAQVQFGSTPL